ncbi:MAG: iron-containing redox enzyme family protein [Bdellovibrionales bacterium]|nr:iron-containing redox enzyme family protein [Bdellovibrionales bacterium]
MSLKQLKERLTQEFMKLGSSPYLAQVMEPGFADKRLYGLYLLETYHYTYHNARNQALVATRPERMDVRYAKFCLKHAEDEMGHELMALHDLKNLGYDVPDEDHLPKPLTATETLIAYLYHVSRNGHPLARLGYSFWAEQSYGYIQPLLEMISGGLGVPNKAMTFFREHSSIDEVHAKQVEETIERFAKTKEDWSAIEECMVNSLILTARMMDQVFEDFMKVKAGETARVPFIK